MGTIREVRKRDDRVVPFDRAKIADAIDKAISSVGSSNRPLAEELAAAVTHFLEQKFSDCLPGIEEIQDQVETVLMETGHVEIARAYILYRNKRAGMREVLKVRKERTGLGDSRGPSLVEDRDGGGPWSKNKIVAALIREAEMEIGLAEEIASAVERKVFASGIQRISTSLIRELVDNELFERGCRTKLRQQAPIGLPKYNLEQILFGSDAKDSFSFPKNPLEVHGLIATEILQQYALEEVYSPAVSGAHREGRLHLHGLGNPIQFERLIWQLEADRQGGFLDLVDLFQKLAHLGRFVAGEIRLCQPGTLLQSGGTAADALGRVEEIYTRMAEIQSGLPGAVFGLEMNLDHSSLPWLQVLAEKPPRKRPVLYFRPAGASREVLELASSLSERGEVIEFLPSTAPARSGIWAVAPAITINVPRAAFRSGADRLGSLENELEEVLELAVRGHLERRQFTERLAARPENPLWGFLGRNAGAGGRGEVSVASSSCPIGVLGLNEAVKFLTGFEFHEDQRARKVGLRTVQTMHRKLERDARGLGLGLVLQETRNTGTVRRLEEIDRQRFLEMNEIDRGRSVAVGRPEGPESARYSDGVRMHRSAPVDPLRRVEHLGSYLDCLVPNGLIEDFPDLRSGGGELILSLLEECLPRLATRRVDGDDSAGWGAEQSPISSSSGDGGI